MINLREGLRRTALGLTALAGAYVTDAALSRQDAFAQTQDARVTARGALAEDAYRPREFALGDNPVVRNGAPLTTANIEGTMSVLAPTTADWAENELRAAIRLTNGYRADGGLDASSNAALIADLRARLAGAGQPAGRPERVNITRLLIDNGYTVDEGTEVFIQTVTPGRSQRYLAGTQGASNTTGVRPIEIPSGYDSLAVLGRNARENEAVRFTIERTVHGKKEQSQIDLYDWCGNGYSLPEAPALPSQEAVQSPCINIRVRPPEGLDFSNENVRARVLVLDMNSGGTLPSEECPVDTGQVMVNCDDVCAEILERAAGDSEGFRRVMTRVRRERGPEATISRIFAADARISADAEHGTYVTVPVLSEKLNDNFVTIICFDWDENENGRPGGSSVVVVHSVTEADENGFIRDQLVMEGRGQNMDVFQNGRRTSRGARHTD